jgi:AraC family transcriptional activator of pobA
MPSRAPEAASIDRPVLVRRLSGCEALAPRPVSHPHTALLFCVAGRSFHEQSGRLEVRSGDVILIPSGQPHRRVASEGVEAWGLGFCATCSGLSGLGPLMAPFERVRAGASACVTIPPDRREHLTNLFRELERELAGPRGAHREVVEHSLVALILAEVARAAAPSISATATPSLVARAIALIEQRGLGPLSLRDVAEALDVTAGHLTTQLRRATGRTAGEWIAAVRLAEARSRLLHTEEPVESIAWSVGYADPTHFIRRFKRESGVTPAAWRAAHRASST